MAAMRIYFILSFASIVIASLGARLRPHHRHDPSEVIHGVRLRNDHVSMTAAYEPIRISVFYDNVQSNLNDKVQTIMTVATAYFKQLLKVRPVLGPLLLERPCVLDRQMFIQGKRYCEISCVSSPQCSDHIIPVDHLQPCRSCKGGQCSISITDPKSPGVPNTDYIMYVSAKDTTACKTAKLVAHALACQAESSLDRPIAGGINFCPGETLKNTLEYMKSVAKHEVIHALGFSKESFAFFRDENGAPRTPRNPVTNLPPIYNNAYDISKVVMTYTHTNWAVANGNIIHSVQMVNTKNVVAQARAHFNCSTLPGLELENGGGPTSELHHWESRLLGDELMTSTNAFTAKISAMTLALLQDSGWYQVDYSKAEPLQWGKNAGCQFVLGSCGGFIKSQLALGRSIAPFCTTITDPSKPLKLGCTSERDATGYCNLVKQTVSSEYQYFGKDLGGSTAIYDNCPFHEAFNYLDGRGTYCKDVKNAPSGTNFLGETFGSQSSCLYEGSNGWSVTMMSTGKVIDRVPNNYGAGCYQVSSTRGTTTVTVLNKTYQCSKSGQQININTSLNGLKYEGSLLCP